jgi:hypothetical protein
LGDEEAARLAGLGAHRLQVYRRHTRRTLRRAAGELMPRTAARLGEAFGAWVDRWIEEESSRSPYFRDVAFEFFTWAAPRWAHDPVVPPYVADLARHELAVFEVRCALHSEASAPSAELTLDRGVCFLTSVRLVRYEHAVHRLEASLDARDPPERTPTALLMYRDADHEVRSLELTALAAAILERLLGGDTLQQAVVGASGSDLNSDVTTGTAALLVDLRTRGAILGGTA